MRKRKAYKGPRDNLLMEKAYRHFADEFAPVFEYDNAAPQEVKLRILAQTGDLPGQAFRKTDVIGIHPGDKLTFAESDRLVEAGRKSGGTGFPNEANALVTEILDDGAALIGRAIVDDDQFPIAQGLQPN